MNREGRWQLSVCIKYVKLRSIKTDQHWLNCILRRSRMRPMTSIMKVPLPQVFNIQIPRLFVLMCLCRTGATHTISLAR